jgi:hypothetical protein
MWGVLADVLGRLLPKQRAIVQLSFSLADPTRLGLSDRCEPGVGFFYTALSCGCHVPALGSLEAAEMAKICGMIWLVRPLKIAGARLANASD